MAELNKVLLIGRLTKDPELRYTPGGTAVAEFRLAVNHTYRTREEKREETCFIDINLLGRSAEVAKEYLAKGREVFVEGRIKLDTWEGQDGQKRSKYFVIADRFQFLGGRGSAESSSAPAEDAAAAGFSGGSSSRGSTGQGAPPQEEEDDLPF